MRDHAEQDWEWLKAVVKGPMIHESPDHGKTIRSRISADHPIHVLIRGHLPFDTWYKIYGNGYE